MFNGLRHPLALPQRQTEDTLHLREMARLDHTVRLIEHEEPELLNLPCERVVLSDVSHLSKPHGDVTTGRTCWMMSHSRPGVATSTSTPRERIRRCFCADIPPTIAATLTGGGPLRFVGSLGSLLLTFCLPFFFGWDLAGRPVSSCSSCLTSKDEVSTELRHALRCDETCNASSRVGVRTRARTGRRSFAGEPEVFEACLSR